MRLSWIFIIGFIIEIWLLITWGSDLGLLGTLFEFILSASVGVYLIRYEGFTLLTKVNREMQQGVSPDIEVMPSLMTIIAAILLIIPGFFGDIIAIILLLPWVKNRLLQHLWSGMNHNATHKKKQQKQQSRKPIIIDQKED